MSGSLTVVGGVNSSTITGLVTVPAVLPNLPNIINNLQAFLTSTVSSAVTLGSAVANFENIVALTSGNQSVSVQNGAVTTGLLELTNTDSTGATLPGTSNVSVHVPVGYNFLVVQAPGTETVTGNASDNFLGVFGSQAGVTFNSGGGSGTVAAGGPGDYVVVSGSTWSVIGNAAGGAHVDSSATVGTQVIVTGAGNAVNNAIGADSTPSNIVGLAGNATVLSSGTNDLIEQFVGNGVISVSNSANVLVNGGNDTVFAVAGSSAVKAFFNANGGSLNFINQSSTSATVSGDVPGASGGNLTAFGGAGGGVYLGGSAGSNSLIGGSGSVTLGAAGTNNILSVSGFGGSYATQNILQAGAGGATMVATSTTGYNEFYGGSGGNSPGPAGTDSIVSFGSGAQTFYVGSTGAETLTGSTVSGASNDYIFNQDSSGNGQDVITNFRLGNDHINVNGNGSLTGVSIHGFSALLGGTAGTEIFLSDATTIQLYGVNVNSLSPTLIGGTSI
jgi:hypothetical protein